MPEAERIHNEISSYVKCMELRDQVPDDLVVVVPIGLIGDSAAPAYGLTQWKVDFSDVLMVLLDNVQNTTEVAVIGDAQLPHGVFSSENKSVRTLSAASGTVLTGDVLLMTTSRPLRILRPMVVRSPRAEVRDWSVSTMA